MGGDAPPPPNPAPARAPTATHALHTAGADYEPLGHKSSAGAPSSSKNTNAKGNTKSRQTQQYQDLRQREDYCSSRLAKCRQRTRRLLRSGQLVELARSKALLEMFYWKRVVYDEAQEVVSLTTKGCGQLHRQALKVVLCNKIPSLKARASWRKYGCLLVAYPSHAHLPCVNRKNKTVEIYTYKNIKP